ncbi:MAG TPA: type II toxin-antitoxin system RelE/ParE family toxin [Terracidiphilus sp.]
MVEVRQTEIFAKWLHGLRDRQAKRIILIRLERLALGNPGDTKPVGSGVTELRILHGPGYRVYFVRRGKTLVILLCGGDKSTQAVDIARAKTMARELEE